MRNHLKVVQQIKLVACFLALLVIVLWAWNSGSEASSTSGASPSPTPTPIVFPSITPSPPPDIPGGAPNATLQQAAIFAWQEFIALNWPSNWKPVGGTRDNPDTSKFFGDQSAPLVWQTYRAKVEIFPGKGTAANGPHGYPKGPPDYGYDDPPEYDYRIPVAACTGQSVPTQPAWINLDETSQIALDSMYAGVGPAPTPGGKNSQPKLIRFMAKANKTQYTYVVSNKFWYTSPAATAPVRIAQQNFVKAVTAVPPVVPTGPIVDFPDDTFEIKAAFRPLNSNEDNSRYHLTMVRYYEKQSGRICFREDQWALIALHIIRKTPTAPSFIYATFEQADNILLPALDKSGKPVSVEDADGNIINKPVPTTPTSPNLMYTDSATNPLVTRNPTSSPYCTSPGAQIYYQNTAGLTGLPSPGNICVNQRDNPIPSDVIAVNTAAHAAIAAYNTKNGVVNSPWPYYKLVNVQAYPFDITKVDPSDPNGMYNPATFYQANIVVETNTTLQMFHGRIAATGPATNFPAANSNPPPAMLPPPPNVYVYNGTKISAYNMGGCMGCHGNAQVKGSDFSFILNQGPVSSPDAPAGGATVLRKVYLDQFKARR